MGQTLAHIPLLLTASNSLALFKTPVSRGGFSTDSASPSRANRRSLQPNNPPPAPGPLTETLPDAEGALLLGFALLALPSVIYSVMQMGSLISGGVLENAIRAFAP